MTEAPFHTELARGDILDGAYRVVRLIAQGGMGYVYEAEQLRLERRVALKILSVDPKKSGEFLPRFRREAEICAKLAHPNIIQVVDWNVTHGMPYMVMEYLDGEDLGFRLSRGPLSFDEALPIIADIAQGLVAAHAHGVVHRDLKPSNIFLSNVGGARPHVKLLDFGVSKVAWETTLSTTSPKVLGSPRYMAPEQARGDSNVDARIDQFAFGAVIYEMLSGSFAFDGESLTTVLYRVVHEPPTPLATLAPNLLPHVYAVVERAMAKAAPDRYQDIAQMMQALRGEVPANVPHRREVVTAQAQSLKPDNTLHGDLTTAAKSGRPAVIAGFAVLAVVLAFAVWRFQSTEAAVGAPALAPPPPQAAAIDPVPTPVAPVPTATPPKPPETSTKPVKAVRESAQVKALLDDAQRLYDAHEYTEAITRGRQALGYGEAPRASLIITMSHCNLSSLGEAKAAFYSVRDEDRSRVIKVCKARGIDL